MRYMLMLFGDETAWADMTPEEAAADMGRWDAFTQDAKAAGAFVSGEGLQPTAAATTVRNEGGDHLVTDGPYTETKEQLVGYYLLECANLDEAIAWAKRIPARQGGTEIRPVLDYDAVGGAADPAAGGTA